MSHNQSPPQAATTWARANLLYRFRASAPERAILRRALALQDQLLGLRTPPVDYWVAPADSPVCQEVPAGAHAFARLYPAPVDQIVLSEQWLAAARADSPNGALEVARVLVHERTHIAVTAACRSRLRPPPWPALVANFFEAIAAAIDRSVILGIGNGGLPSPDAVEGELHAKQRVLACVAWGLLRGRDTRTRARTMRHLVCDLITAETTDGLAAALNRAVDPDHPWHRGRDLTWADWEASLPLLWIVGDDVRLFT